MSDNEHSHSEGEDDYIEELEINQAKKSNQRTSKREAVSAEVIDNICKPSTEFKVKSKELHDKLFKLIENSFIFKTIDIEDQEIIINAMEENKFNSGEQVIKQGQDGSCMQLVESGELDCSKVFNEEEGDKYLKTQVCGEIFGELALMYNAPRAASIKAKTDAVLWKLDRNVFNQQVKDASMRRRVNLLEFINSVDILKELKNNEKDKLADCFIKHLFSDGQNIINQGEEGDKFYILKEGNAVAQKDGTEVKSQTPGDQFGELALIKNQNRAATVTAKGKCLVLSLDRQSFSRVLGPLDGILKRNMETYQNQKIE